MRTHNKRVRAVKHGVAYIVLAPIYEYRCDTCFWFARRESPVYPEPCGCP